MGASPAAASRRGAPARAREDGDLGTETRALTPQWTAGLNTVFRREIAVVWPAPSARDSRSLHPTFSVHTRAPRSGGRRSRGPGRLAAPGAATHHLAARVDRPGDEGYAPRDEARARRIPFAEESWRCALEWSSSAAARSAPAVSTIWWSGGSPTCSSSSGRRSATAPPAARPPSSRPSIWTGTGSPSARGRCGSSGAWSASTGCRSRITDTCGSAAPRATSRSSTRASRCSGSWG